MGIKYDSEDALQTVDQVMKIFRDTAYETSKDLAKEKDAFPNFNWKGFRKSKFNCPNYKPISFYISFKNLTFILLSPCQWQWTVSFMLRNG